MIILTFKLEGNICLPPLTILWKKECYSSILEPESQRHFLHKAVCFIIFIVSWSWRSLTSYQNITDIIPATTRKFIYNKFKNLLVNDDDILSSHMKWISIKFFLSVSALFTAWQCLFKSWTGLGKITECGCIFNHQQKAHFNRKRKVIWTLIPYSTG